MMIGDLAWSLAKVAGNLIGVVSAFGLYGWLVWRLTGGNDEATAFIICVTMWFLAAVVM